MQTQQQKSVESPAPAATTETRSSGDQEPPSDMFTQEDDIADWLHYPVDDTSLQTYLYNNDLLYPTPPFSAPTYPPLPPPPSITLPSRPPELQSSTIVASNATPPPAHTPDSRTSRVSDKPAPVSTSGVGGGTLSAGMDIETCEMSVSVTSSPGSSGSGESAGVEPSSEKPPPMSDDRKRKPGGTDGDDAEIYSEDVEFGYHDVNKQSHGGSTSTKRPRSSEVHNLSERRRRDRINEKMKALQELIPHCNKSDKASMLDETIEYLKSLQMQVHMMSMGCGMVPTMYLGVQQYMAPNPPMVMGMGIGINHAMFPYPAILPGPPLPNPAVAAATAAAHLSQRFPAPGFNMTPAAHLSQLFPAPGINMTPVTGPTANLSVPMMSSLTLNSQNQPQVLGFADPFQRYPSLHQTELPLPQNRGGVPLIATKVSSSKDATNPDHHHHKS